MSRAHSKRMDYHHVYLLQDYQLKVCINSHRKSFPGEVISCTFPYLYKSWKVCISVFSLNYKKKIRQEVWEMKRLNRHKNEPNKMAFFKFYKYKNSKIFNILLKRSQKINEPRLLIVRVMKKKHIFCLLSLLKKIRTTIIKKILSGYTHR